MEKKKILALTLTGAMAIASLAAFVACGDPDDEEGGGNYTVDTTEYYLVGSGINDGDYVSTLATQGWDQTDHTLKLVQDSAVTDANCFLISNVKLYANDQFQICHDDSWDGQLGLGYCYGLEAAGIGYQAKDVDGALYVVGGTDGGKTHNMVVLEGADGIYDIRLYTFPDGDQENYITFTKTGTLEAVKVYYKMFLNSDTNNFGLAGNSSEYNMTNIGEGKWRGVITVTEDDLCRNATGEKVTEGGEYVAINVRNTAPNFDEYKDLEDGFELKEYIANEEDTLYSYAEITVRNTNDLGVNLLPEGTFIITYSEATDSITIEKRTHLMQFIGSFQEWATNDDDYLLTESTDGSYWTGTLTVTEAVTLKLYNQIDGKYYTTPELTATDGNISLEAGTYVFKYTLEDNVVEYEQCGWWIVGTFMDGGNKIDHKIKTNVTPKFEASETEGVYTATLVATDVTDQYDWISGKPGYDGSQKFCFQIVYGSELLGATEWGVASSSDTIVAPGTWTVSLDTSDWSFTVVAAE